MTAAELYEAGRLQAAIDQQIVEVKAAPADSTKRLFLFDLFAFAGELDRAARQLDAIATDDIQQQAAIQSYRRLVDAERLRRLVFEGKGRPKFLGDVPAHVEHRLEAVLHLSKGDLAAASEALARAAETTPALRGTLNGETFELLVDCDDLFGTVVEVVAGGDYFWVPLEQIESIRFQPPKYPVDLIWRPASLETPRSHGEVFMPVLYPGSHTNADDQVRLGRLTDWVAGEVGPVRGVGVHTFLADERDVSLLEWADVEFEVAHETPPEVEMVDEPTSEPPSAE
ncbi:MAG: type VI secretion system accessory protein TagJ [Isosphaeraceae bacterium]|nr:type VI secretion system accessory protein TagJ [Isosphaeraceae bacterium]